MNNKETLIRLIQESVDGCAENWARQIADYLLDHGTYLPGLEPITIIDEKRLTNAEFVGLLPDETYQRLCMYENLEEDGLLFAFKPIDTSEILEK